jgi:hypothetical protein
MVTSEQNEPKLKTLRKYLAYVLVLLCEEQARL